jgi:hypothetical protein
LNPLLDHILVGAIILAALAYFLKRFLPKRGGKSCDAGCGCGTAKQGIKQAK